MFKINSGTAPLVGGCDEVHFHAREFTLIWLSADRLVFSQIIRSHVPFDYSYVFRNITGQLSTVKRFGIVLHLFQGLCILFVLDFVSLFTKLFVFIQKQFAEMTIQNYDVITRPERTK